MTTLAEIEKAVDALLCRLSTNLAVRQPRHPLDIPPPDVPIEEIERIEALIEAEFSQV